MDTPIFNLLSLCTGYAGLDIAVSRIFRTRILVYCENEAYAIANLLEKMEEGRIDKAPVWTDLKTFPKEEFRGMVDVVCGGYPCQGFSVAGKKKGEQDPRFLWPYIRDIIKVTKPKICIFENVRGHVRLGLSRVLVELRDLGYETRAGLFAASEIGAPHKRERVFILGFAESWGFNRFCEESEKSQIQIGRSSDELADAKNIGWFGRSEEVGQGKITTISRHDKDLANTDSSRSQRCRESGECGDEFIIRQSSERSTLYPARPNEEQYDWECPRVNENGNLNVDFVTTLMGILPGWTDIDYGYNQVPTTENCNKILLELQKSIGTKEVSWEIGRFLFVFKEEVLYNQMPCGVEDQKQYSDKRFIKKKSAKIQEKELRKMSNQQKFMRSSYRWKSSKQRSPEFNDFMQSVSHSMALGAWNDFQQKCGQVLQNLRKSGEKISPWNVHETLPEMETIWRSTSNEDCWAWWMASMSRYLTWQSNLMIYREERLRLCGNGVVPDQAEYAIRTLLKDFI